MPAAAIGIIVVLVFIGLLLLNTGTAAREGTYRRGVGWYADMSTPRETLAGQSAVPGPRTIPTWKVWAWLYAGVAFLVGAAVMVPFELFLAGLLAFLGLALLGLAWDGRRRNRRALELGDSGGSGQNAGEATR